MEEANVVTNLLLEDSLTIPIEIDNLANQSIQLTEENIPLKGEINIIYSDQSGIKPASIHTWSKSLTKLPVFTIKEIEQHRQLSGKVKGLSIAKTLSRGRKFKDERYLKSDSVYTLVSKNTFKAKCKCKASMKKIMRDVEVSINRITGKVEKGSCNCPAGQSGYCNHAMALLLELADYSLKGLKLVPEEKACTSTVRQWGIPGQKDIPKAPVMNTAIKKQTNKQGINSTLFDPRINHDYTYFSQCVDTFKEKLANEDIRIGYAHCIPNKGFSYVDTKFGMFPLGSPLSFHLQAIDDDFKLLTNIFTCSNIIKKQTKDMCDLPYKFFNGTESFIPKDWTLSGHEEEFLKTLQIDGDMAKLIEKSTVEQSNCDEWFQQRKFRITSSNAHKVYIRQKKFESLADGFTGKQKKRNKFVEEAMQHGRKCEPIARDLYADITKYKLKRNIIVRETGIVIQPHLYWLAASPDGLVRDDNDASVFGLIEIKCPASKKHMTPEEILQDESFYVGIKDDQLYLKKKHSNGYYTQIQMALGLSRLMFCDFVVYSFKGMIIMRVPFDEDYFVAVIQKLNVFFKSYLITKFTTEKEICEE